VEDLRHYRHGRKVLNMQRRVFSTATAAAKKTKKDLQFGVALYGWHTHSLTRRQQLEHYFRGEYVNMHSCYDLKPSHPEYTDLKPLSAFSLTDANVKAVVIGAPGAASVDFLSKCIDSGKHVLMEKGSLNADVTAEEAKKLIELAEKKDTVLMFPSFKRRAPHYVDALRNWCEPEVRKATKSIQVIMRDDLDSVVLTDTKAFLRDHVYPDLDFVSLAFSGQKLSVEGVAQADYGVDVQLVSESGVDVRLSYYGSSPKFLYKLLWNDRCVVRVEGLVHVFDQSGDYFAEALLNEMEYFRDSMRNFNRRRDVAKRNLQVVPKTLQLIDEVSSFPNKSVLEARGAVDLEQQLREMVCLREIGIGSQIDNVHHKKF
jgi:hypothetical protein